MAYNAQWHKERYERLYVEKEQRRARNAAVIRAAREDGCSRCPERDWRCIDFHHVDPATKSFDLGGSKARDASLERLHNELAKCERLCANCHRKEHLSG